MDKIDYIKYIQSDYWKRKRLWFISKIHPTMRKCFLCKSPDNLIVHHKRYYRRGKSILYNEYKKDLKLCCEKCHNFIHKHGLAYNYGKVKFKDILELMKEIKE